MKTNELTKGETYLAKIGYSTYRVEVLEAALYTDRVIVKRETVIEMVDPAQKFNPDTGELNPQVERSTVVRKDETVREPGFKPRKAGSYSGSDAVAGVPCLVFSTYRESDMPGKERLVRPQDILQTWASHVKGVEKAKVRETERKVAEASFADRVRALPSELNARIPFASEYGGGRDYTRSTTDVRISLAALEALLSK